MGVGAQIGRLSDAPPMSTFACAADLSGVTDVALEEYVGVDATIDPSDELLGVVRAPGFVGWMSNAQGGPQMNIAHADDIVGIGTIRLDNRATISQLCCNARTRTDDLVLALRFIQRYGIEHVDQLEGDFAFVVWDPTHRTLYAVRDALGVRQLSYKESGSRITSGSDGSLLANGNDFDPASMGEFLVNGSLAPGQSIYAGIVQLRPGEYRVWGPQLRKSKLYWSVGSVSSQPTTDAREAAARFKELFQLAVKQRISNDGRTWARLSGGLDSSSIVCTASDLAERGEIPFGVDGTITTVDTLGRGDEREFVKHVLDRYRLRNQTIVDYWMWQDDGDPPPLTDSPTTHYPYFARDRRGATAVRSNGGCVLLCGLGADDYLGPSRAPARDSFARGDYVESLTTLARWAAYGRRSFWSLVLTHILLPRMPGWLRSQFRKQGSHVPRWLERNFVRQQALEARVIVGRVPSSTNGEHAREQMAMQLGRLPTFLRREVSAGGLEVRYPFLARSLVEFVIGLPDRLRVTPGHTKLVLRAAMAGIVPDAVLARQGKGTIGARALWSLSKEHERVDDLLRDPILCQLGCVRLVAIRAATKQAQEGHHRIGRVLNALALETWLRVRTGQWNNGRTVPSSTFRMAAQTP